MYPLCIFSKLLGQLRSEHTQNLLIKILHRLAQPGTLIVLENAHFLDSGSWALALAACQQLEGVLIAITLRPSKTQQTFQYSQILHLANASHLELHNLNLEEATELIAQRLNMKKVPEMLASQVSGKRIIMDEIIRILVRDMLIRNRISSLF